MNRGQSFLILALVLGCGSGGPPEIRNVVLVSIDTLRADHLGTYGYAAQTSPFIDSLARRGVVFEQAVAQSPWTAPSHAAMFTSTWPSVLGFAGAWTGDRLPGRIHPDAVTLAETLRAEGFRTHAVVGGGFVSAALGFDQGFEQYDESGASWTRSVDRALDWIADEEPSPFFLFLHTYDVHQYRVSAERRADLERRHGGRFAARRDLSRLLQSNDRQALPPNSPAFRAFVIDLYDAAIRAVDAELRRFWDGLDPKATLLVITSDHGEEFWEHGHSGHGYSLHDENVRVPLVFVHPSLPARRVGAQVRLVDLAPTLLELLGLVAPDDWSGVSLVPQIHGDGTQLPAFSEAAHLPFKSLRTPTRKLVISTRRPRLQLFDLERDPGETRPVANPAPELDRLREPMRAWIEQNAADRRFSGATPAEVSPEMRRQLELLGYAADPTASAPPSHERWLAAFGAAGPRHADAP